MRRVVTGLDDAGRSVVVSDGDVPPVRTRLLPGAEWHLLWSDDAPVRGARPTAKGAPLADSYFPPAGGVRFGTFTLPPGEPGPGPSDGDLAAARAEMDAALPGLRETIGDGAHATATVDFELVLAGEVTLELPDGSTTRLRPGDTVVQNGAVHRWVNTGTEPAVIALVMLGVPG